MYRWNLIKEKNIKFQQVKNSMNILCDKFTHECEVSKENRARRYRQYFCNQSLNRNAIWDILILGYEVPADSMISQSCPCMASSDLSKMTIYRIIYVVFEIDTA